MSKMTKRSDPSMMVHNTNSTAQHSVIIWSDPKQALNNDLISTNHHVLMRT
jgi:hypothetical protein